MVSCEIHLSLHPCSRVSFLDIREMLISKCCTHFDLCVKFWWAKIMKWVSIIGLIQTVQWALSTHQNYPNILCLISPMKYLRGLELSNLLLCITLKGLHLDTCSHFHRAQTCITDYGWNLVPDKSDHQYNCSLESWTLNNGANHMSSFYKGGILWWYL